MRDVPCKWLVVFGVVAAITMFVAPTLSVAQVTPPDLGVCDGVDPCDAPGSFCDAGGFEVTLTNFLPANDPNNFTGNAIYTYQICSRPEGVCNGLVRNGEACLDNEFCRKKGQDTDPNATCSRKCAVDVFKGLSHFDIVFPELGFDCMSEVNFVGGTCTCVPTGGGCSVDPNIVLGDGSCFDPTDPVAKCDNTELPVGSCIEMVLQLAGESNLPGLGAGIVISKESTDCNASCLKGPSCEPCLPPPGGEECLTRTLGFWGTHPWITNDYDPVTVCKNDLVCDGADDGESNPSCEAHECNSIMEGLGSIGGELSKAQSYIAMVKQLTAAKLNLNATAALVDGATCSDFEYQGKSIQAWIETCELLCNKSQSQISTSGCIEALDAFNNSEDVGFPVTPAPFDRPPLDDHGNISGADPSAFQDSHSGGYVIGRNVPGGTNCKP